LLVLVLFYDYKEIKLDLTFHAQQLQKPGFVWNPINAEWGENSGRLVQYTKKHVDF